MRRLLFAASILAGSFAAGAAGATIIMVDASSIQGANVLFNSGVQTGTLVTGMTQAGTLVDFTGTDNGAAIIRANGGQARVEGALDTTTANPNDTFLLDSLAFSLSNGDFFNNLEFNLFGGSATSATFTLTDNTGATTTFANQALSNGSSFFGFQGINGESISTVSIALNGGGVSDVRQIRLDEVTGTVTQQSVPEPASWALLITGFAGAGAMMRYRRRAAARPA